MLEILPLCYVVNYLYFGNYYRSEEVYFSNPDTKPPGFRPSQHNTSASHVTPVLTQHQLAGSRYPLTPPEPSAHFIIFFLSQTIEITRTAARQV